jgi:hypothetical protein
MGGVWYWTLWGGGIAALWIYLNAPGELDDPRDGSPAVPRRLVTGPGVGRTAEVA